MRGALLAGALALMLGACVEPIPPSICELTEGEVLVFPVDFTSDVPTNAVVRVLVAGRAADLDVFLIEEDTGYEVAGRLIELPTVYGDVLELQPDYLLEPDWDYRIEVVDRFGDLVDVSEFRTGAYEDDGPPTVEGRVDLVPVTASERACCSGRACKEGTLIEVPAPERESFHPQLILLEVSELYNDYCGPASAPADTVPVVFAWDGSSRLLAETDRILTGCFEVVVVDQALRTGNPDGVVCTRGYSWDPAPVNPDCVGPPSGCSCRAASSPSRPLWALILGLWLVWRRRSVAGAKSS